MMYDVLHFRTPQWTWRIPSTKFLDNILSTPEIRTLVPRGVWIRELPWVLLILWLPDYHSPVSHVFKVVVNFELWQWGCEYPQSQLILWLPAYQALCSQTQLLFHKDSPSCELWTVTAGECECPQSQLILGYHPTTALYPTLNYYWHSETYSCELLNFETSALKGGHRGMWCSFDWYVNSVLSMYIVWQERLPGVQLFCLKHHVALYIITPDMPRTSWM